MNRAQLLDVFSPRYNQLFPVIQDNAENLVLTAELLEILLRTTDLQKQTEIILRFNEFQKTSDSLVVDTYYLLKSLIVVPFDKEDINELVNQINYLTESVIHIGRMFYSGKIDANNSVYTELAGIITRSSNEIRVCCRHLRNTEGNKTEINTCLDNLQHYDKSAKETFYSSILSLLANDEDTVILTKTKKILEMFTKCIHQTATVTKVIKAILIKAM